MFCPRFSPGFPTRQTWRTRAVQIRRIRSNSPFDRWWFVRKSHVANSRFEAIIQYRLRRSASNTPAILPILRSYRTPSWSAFRYCFWNFIATRRMITTDDHQSYHNLGEYVEPTCDYLEQSSLPWILLKLGDYLPRTLVHNSLASHSCFSFQKSIDFTFFILWFFFSR